jgi:hypothetical protein
LYQSLVNGLYTTTLSSSLSVKQSPQDPWGNIKIPVYESLATESDESSFKAIPDDNQTDWVSLLGLPVIGLKKGLQVNSTITTRYYYINCSQLSGVDSQTDWPPTFGLPYNSSNIWQVYSSSSANQWQVFLPEVGFPNITHVTYLTSFPASPTLRMVFVSWSGALAFSYKAALNATIAECTIEPSYIDMQLFCEDFSCGVTGARRSAIKTPAVNSSGWASWWGRLMEFRNDYEYDFASQWPQSVSQTDNSANVGQVSPTLNYLNDSEKFPFASTAQLGGAPKLYELDLEEFTPRLRRLFNTYWQASLGPPAYDGSISPDSIATDGAELEASSGMKFNVSNAMFHHDITVYKCDLRWLSITIIVSSLLLAFGFVGFAAKCACVGPDLLNSFTTILRANPQTARLLVDNNSTIDSGNVAKSNRNLFVALQDVESHQEAGFIAINTGLKKNSFDRNNFGDQKTEQGEILQMMQAHDAG